MYSCASSKFVFPQACIKHSILSMMLLLTHLCWQVDLTGIRPTPEVAEVYQGVSAPKRKRVEEQPVVTEIPKVGSVLINEILFASAWLMMQHGGLR